jgi:ubiquinone/menaquinone biosynthesis C-methylase UbiE
MANREGWKGWDEYAPFYDWENARTLGRRDVAFWQRLAARAEGAVLELGCGTGRVSLPLAKAGVRVVGVDRSAGMLARAAMRRARLNRGRKGATKPLTLVRSDIRTLPFVDAGFSMVLAPYGILQSLLRETDLKSTLESVFRVLAPGGTFGIDLVPDVPQWQEYSNRTKLKGRTTGGARLTLVESVRQQPGKHLTTFEQRYVQRRRNGRSVEHRFELRFRTPPLRQIVRSLEAAGFSVTAILGDYRGRPWDERAEVWLILATRSKAALGHDD